MKLGTATAYIVLMPVVLILFNVDIGKEALLAWTVASFCLGWITRYPSFAFLPFLASPMAIPFGYPGSMASDPLVLWAAALFYAPFQAAVVLIGFGGRLLYERFHDART